MPRKTLNDVLAELNNLKSDVLDLQKQSKDLPDMYFRLQGIESELQSVLKIVNILNRQSIENEAVARYRKDKSKYSIPKELLNVIKWLVLIIGGLLGIKLI